MNHRFRWRCLDCDGRGRARLPGHDCNTGAAITIEDDCYTCGGKGWVRGPDKKGRRSPGEHFVWAGIVYALGTT